MKRCLVIGIFLMGLVSLMACRHHHDDPVETRFIASPELSAIDSMMWQRPDSALACLLPYFDTCCRDAKFCVSTATAYNRHYAHLLLSELLYKNDYAQTNRTELLQAVTYFDSLVREAPPFKEVPQRVGDSKHKPNPNDNLVFLTARAHYINGVGYYERDSLVEACSEYLKALEVMEEYFDEKDLVGRKAQFMTYTFNRLGDLFSEQFMMESAISCYEQALVFCRIKPTSPQGVSNILYRLGKQYDKIGEKETARDYYGQAIERMPSTNTLVYRDMVATKALSDYQHGLEIEQPLKVLRRVLKQAVDEKERLTRFLIIGGIYFEERIYDSALFYLEPLFEDKENVVIQKQAVNYLRIIYDSLGNREKSDECVHFLINHANTESQNKSLVSQLDNLFQSHMNQKQERKAAQEKRDAVLRTVKVLIPIAFLVAAIVIMIIRRRNKKKLAEQDAEAKQELEMESKRHAEAMETVHQVHRMEQAAISGRLKRSNEALRELKDQINQQEELVERTKQAASFAEEPIYHLIMERVNEGQFLSQMDCTIYKDYALDKNQLSTLRKAVDRHFNKFTTRISEAHPELTRGDLDYCCLYLLGLTDADVAALMQRAYNTINERNSKLRRIFGSENAISITLQSIANESTTV